MKHISLSIRIWLVLLLLLSAMLLNAYLESKNTSRAIESYYRDQVIDMVTLGQNILKHYQSRVRSGDLSVAEAQKRALEAVSAMRFDGGNYIFMGDADGISISNGIKELVGTNIMGMQDPTGKPLVKELYRVASEGGGFVDYQWPDPVDKSVLLPKSSYAEYFAPWQWTLGSGLNIAQLQQDQQALAAENRQNLVLILLVAVALAVFFINSINRQLRRLLQAMTALAAGSSDLSSRLPEEGGKEHADFAASYNRLAETLQQMAQQVDEDGRRFLSAIQRMQTPGQQVAIPDNKQLTLDQLQQMVYQICRQAEALEHSHEALKQMAEQDPATGLLTVQAFESRVREQLKQLDSNTPNTFALLAFDQLPPAKDLFLEQVSMTAGIIRHTLPDDVLACYIPDKGFVYWCRYSNTSEGMRMAISLQQQVSDALSEQQSVSAGLSAVLGGHKSYELLFSEAERALIRAQREGGNRVYEY